MAASSNRKIQVFAVLKEIYREVAAADFPVLFGALPEVTFGDFDDALPNESAERIHITHRVRDGDQAWVQNRSKEETITTELDVVTAWPGRSGPDVLDRLEELVEVLYALWHPADGTFTAPASGLGPHIQNLGGVVSCRVNVYPQDGVGYTGVATLTLQTSARITT